MPFATPLIGMLMLGNLMKESGVVERLTKASSQEIANVVTLFLGLAIGSTMVGAEFLKPSARSRSWCSASSPSASTPPPACCSRKLLNVLSRRARQPADRRRRHQRVPDGRARRAAVAQEEDFENFLLMHAMGANAAGQIASVVAGGVLLALMGAGGH